VSSPSSQLFECRWKPSGRLLALYLVALALAGVTLLAFPVPRWFCALGLLLLLVHASWAIPSRILLSHRSSWRGLRQEPLGWSLWSRSGGWQPVQLRPDSMALPSLVVLRFKLPGQWFSRSLCILPDAMSAEQHRRLRLRLKFSRRRWAAPG
jgi:toxin CptA